MSIESHPRQHPTFATPSAKTDRYPNARLSHTRHLIELVVRVVEACFLNAQRYNLDFRCWLTILVSILVCPMSTYCPLDLKPAPDFSNVAPPDSASALPSHTIDPYSDPS